jgi:subtilisin family serine protease
MAGCGAGSITSGIADEDAAADGGDAAADGGDGFRYAANGGNSTGGISLAPSDSMCAHSSAVQLPNVRDGGSVILEELEALETAYCHCRLLVSLSSICRDKVRAAACASSRSRCRPSAAAAAAAAAAEEDVAADAGNELMDGFP